MYHRAEVGLMYHRGEVAPMAQRGEVAPIEAKWIHRSEVAAMTHRIQCAIQLAVTGRLKLSDRFYAEPKLV